MLAEFNAWQYIVLLIRWIMQHTNLLKAVPLSHTYCTEHIQVLLQELVRFL